MKLNASPRDWIFAKAARARHSVDVVSPWLSLEPVKALLAALGDDVPLRMVFRWPKDASDARALDPAAIECLAQASHARPLRVEYASGALHAKVVRIDDLALVTSANFTTAGLGDNVELGTVIGALPGVVDWLDGLATSPLGDDARARLLQGLHSLAETEADGFPRPPRGRVEIVYEALSDCGIPAQHLDHGYGQNAWAVPLFRRRPARVKAQVSTANGGVFHFKITRKDDHRLQSGNIHGLVLVPTEPSDAGPVPATGAPRLVLVPASALYAPHGLGRGALRAHSELSLLLEVDKGRWRLRLPNAGGRGGREAVASLASHRPAGKTVLRCRPQDWRRHP